jgi:hypothetical protein
MRNPFRRSREMPIQNIGSIDVMAQRKDGGVDLVIVASSRLASSPEHQRLLLDKIESYLAQLNGPDFKSEFGDPSSTKVRILVACTEAPDPMIVQLIEKSQPWVAENRASLELEVGI